MPNISSHMIVAKEISKKININSDDFYRGNLLPDVIDMNDSHHKIKKGLYLIPDIDYHLKTLDLTKDLDKGYLTHLLLDKHYLEEYLTNLYPNKNIFVDRLIYKDYDYLNYDLVKRFDLDLDYLNKILTNYKCKVLEDKLKYNLECLNQNKKGKTTYLEIDSLSSFLKDISPVISDELLNCINKVK